MQAKTLQYNPMLKTQEGEALGLLEVMKWAASNHWDKVIFELDAKIVVDSIHSSNVGISEFRTIVSNCKNFSCFNFLNSKVEFAR